MSLVFAVKVMSLAFADVLGIAPMPLIVIIGVVTFLSLTWLAIW
jgi:hypothetical protein